MNDNGGSCLFGIIAVATELGLVREDEDGERFGIKNIKYIIIDDTRLLLAGSMRVAAAASHGTVCGRGYVRWCS
jgi:hypothetical protein